MTAEFSPDWMPLGNPLEIWPAVMLHGADKVYPASLKAVLNDPNIDGVICVAIAPLPEFSFLDVSLSLNKVMEEFPPDKPVIVRTYGPNTKEVCESFESQRRIMTFPNLETAAWALALLRDRYKIMNHES